jgi:hypothetical protein
VAEPPRFLVDDELASAGVWFIQRRLSDGRFAKAEGPFETVQAANARCSELNRKADR